MERVGVNTTQNVAIDYEIASVGYRILATLLDFGVFFFYFLLLAFVGEVSDWNSSMSFMVLGMFPVYFYSLYCELLFGGQSFGKYLLKIKVIKLNGSQPNFGGYLLRWLFRIIDILAFQGVIAIIAILFNGKGQRLGDIAAGTSVIRVRKKINLKDTILKDVQKNYVITFKEVEKLSDKDIAIINSILMHSIKNQKWSIINQLAEKTKETMNVTTTLNPVDFLKTVLKDYTNFQFDR